MIRFDRETAFVAVAIVGNLALLTLAFTAHASPQPGSCMADTEALGIDLAVRGLTVTYCLSWAGAGHVWLEVGNQSIDALYGAAQLPPPQVRFATWADLAAAVAQQGLRWREGPQRALQ